MFLLDEFLSFDKCLLLKPELAKFHVYSAIRRLFVLFAPLVTAAPDIYNVLWYAITVVRVHGSGPNTCSHLVAAIELPEFILVI